jgi:hypothetical protein
VQVDAEGSAAWTKLLRGQSKLTPAKVVRRLTQGLPIEVHGNLKVEINRIPDGVALVINCKAPNADAEDDGAWDRQMCAMSLCRTITADEDGRITMVDERTDMRTGGCKELYRNLLPLYEELGVTEVTLSADEVGSYAWVRYGFRPDPKEWRKLGKKLTQRLAVLSEQIADEAQVGRIENIIASSDPEAIVAIANLKNPNFTERSLGFAMLEKNIWKGKLDLGDEDTLAAVRKYVGL